MLGTTASAGKGKSAPQGGVLGAIQAAGQLPFTGFRLWLAVVAALTLIGLGIVLRHRTRVIA